jgi:hypothetical protein
MARESDGLGVQRQLNALFEQRLSTENRILQTMQQELKIAIQIQAAMKDMAPEELQERLDQASASMKNIAEEAQNVGGIGTKAMKDISDSSSKTQKSVGVVGGIFTGMLATMKQIGTTAIGVAGSMFKIGKAMLSIPMSIFKNLLADAASMGGDTSFMQALEDIRKEFGAFSEGTSKNILDAYKTMNTQLQQVSGLSVWRVFGTPAEQLKYLHEMASKAGSQILQFGDEISKSAGIVATFDKGMGIGAENMKAMMNRATVFGTTLISQLGSTANYALQLGKDFGISSKIISREVGVMMKDVRNFGSLTQKEMTVAAVYTKKLGLEMKDLTGLVDKFDNFDKAAESAAQLSQAFGASVDAFKLMNEQDPAKRLDDLRKSMAATGKSTENMTRQELHLLAQTSGLSDEAAKLAFSTKNQGLSYDQVQKQANKAENAQIKQADALAKLADNIERVVRSGGQMHGSFFKMFFAGMEQGVKWSNTYRTAMMNVRQSLMETFWAGRQVGNELGNNATVGLGRFMKGFGDTFSPKNVRKVLYGFKDENGKQMKGVVENMTDVFKGNQTFESAINNIRNTFRGAIDKKSLENMKEGGKDMMRFLAKGIGSGAAFVTKELIHVFKTLTGFITNPKKYMEEAAAAGAGGASFGMELIKTIKDSFGDPQVLQELKIAVVDFAKTIAAKLKAALEDPAVQKKLFELGTPILTAMLGKQMLSLAPTVIARFGPMFVRALSAGGLGGAVAAAGGIALAGAALVNVNKKMDQFEQGIDNRRDPASKKIGAYGASLLQGLTLGLVPDSIATIMANKMAELADAVFNAVANTMGGPFTKKLKTYFGAQINFLGSVGGLLGAIFSGDSAQITAAATKVGNNFVGLISVAFDFLITEFPKLLMKLSSSVLNVTGSILKGLGPALIEFGDRIPIIGGLVKGLGAAVWLVGETFKTVGGWIETVFQAIKEFDIGQKFDKMFTSLKMSFNEFALGVLNTIPGPILTFLGLNAEGRDFVRKNLEDNQAQLRQHIESLKTIAKEAEHVKVEAVEHAAQAQITVKDPTMGLGVPQEKLAEFNEKMAKSNIAGTIAVTQDIVKSVNELNAALGSGEAGAMKLGQKLQKFADNSGLGKSGTYEIKNKGIQLKLDLKITMDAGEVEKAILMRKESILFDAIEETASAYLTDQNKERLKALRGGG